MIDTDLIQTAISIATRAHAGQTDKSGQPYIDHCRRVSEGVEGTEAKIVAWLHDVLEDTNVTESELRKEFSSDIVDAIVVLAHPNGERNDIYWERVRSNPLARQVKFADIYDNLDPIRLVTLDPSVADRLRTKYRKALEAL